MSRAVGANPFQAATAAAAIGPEAGWTAAGTGFVAELHAAGTGSDAGRPRAGRSESDRSSPQVHCSCSAGTASQPGAQ